MRLNYKYVNVHSPAFLFGIANMCIQTFTEVIEHLKVNKKTLNCYIIKVAYIHT